MSLSSLNKLNPLNYIPHRPTLMGPSPAKQPPAGEGVYFGVYLPPDSQPSNEDPEGTVVFTDKSEAMKLVKKNKKARFKAFRSETDAMHFAVYGPESTPLSPSGPPDTGEKPSPFRAPKPQDMVRFRKSIEARDLDTVKKTVWENPRYLVSSGDTPAILQEGSRYNALHIAAKSRDAAICAFILQTVGSEGFMRYFYGYSVDVEQRCAVLLDLYLNTPDKALNETPLHFASKFGAASCVQVMVAYAQCDRNARNRYQQTAKDLICSRMTGADSSVKEEISAMLEEQFYVPVLRSPDYSVQPVIGKLFSPTSPLQDQSGGDVISPVLEIQAVAGPMPRQRAEQFRRRWKTPPRQPGSPLLLRPTLTDQEKGWERVGRELAQEWKVPWKEYWPFLDTYVDLNTPEGLQMLEEYFRKRFRNASETTSTDSPQASPASPSKQNGICPESPMEELCRALRACILNSGGPSSPPGPRHPPPSRHPPTTSTRAPATVCLPRLVTSPHLYIEKSCQVFAKRIADGFQVAESELDFLWAEANHLQGLVSSCISDNRFSRLDFQRVHSRLGTLVSQRLDAEELPRIRDSLQALINRKTEEVYSSDEGDLVNEEAVVLPSGRWTDRHRRWDHKTLQAAVVCLAKAVLRAADVMGPGGEPPVPPESEQACADAWGQALPCDCALPSTHRKCSRSRRKHFYCGENTKKPWHKKLDFDLHYNFGEERVEESSSSQGAAPPADSSGEESDTSDTSESEFFTPPSSPGVRSDEELAMESPDEGPDVYINGNTPSKLDMSVMEAIRGVDVSKAQYPNICRWRHLVMLHSEHDRLRWTSSPQHKASPRVSRTPTTPGFKITSPQSPLWPPRSLTYD